ncbi:MAG: rod shape-determining protein MreC [Candidatus Omnitrophota bacterium]|nr:MAG: rod shape-determining protein MreC [Candidatus Omnitrophota bacterium]
MIKRKILFLIFFFLLFLLNQHALGRKVEGYLIDIQRYFLISLNSSSKEVWILRRPTLEEENKRLRKRIKELEQRIVDLEEARQENERLRGLLSFKKPSYINIPAQVIGESADNWRRIVFLDKGKRDGIERDMPVITKEGLVGKVVNVGLRTAEVMLILDPGSRVGALVQRTRDTGIVKGNISSCVLTYLDKYSDLQKGDVIISSGKGGVYPKGLFIGKVSRIEKNLNRLYLEASINPAVDFHHLEEVLCLKKLSP